MEVVMKKLYLVLLVTGIILCAGCSGNQGIPSVNLAEFIGDWYMYGTLYLDIDGRIYEQPIDRVIYIRQGFVQDSLGFTYTATYFASVLELSREEGFTDYDPYCGYFEGGTLMPYTFIGISPFFTQPYEGFTSGSTAVFTQHCTYKQMDIEGTIYIERVN